MLDSDEYLSDQRKSINDSVIIKLQIRAYIHIHILIRVEACDTVTGNKS